MNKRCTAFILTVLLVSLLVPVVASAQQAWIVDILANPSRNWNRTVTLTGQVQNVDANPAGTTRGTYTLLDESCPTAMTVRTNDLPPVGKTFVVTGIVIQDAASSAPILKEVSRSSPGMSTTMIAVLAGAGILFLGLLVVFVVVLMRNKQAAPAPAPVATMRPAAAETIRPAPRPASPPPPPAPAPVADGGRTMKIPPAAEKTQVFMSLGADLLVEKGPDKGKEVPLHKPVTTIGRPGARQNDVELSDDTVSKDQASIYYDGARKVFSIANESSTNPTKVNGQQISGPTQLENGSVIELGRTTLRFKKN